MNISFILCDIEGTTSSISFVHDTLFPLSYEKMECYLLENRYDPDLESRLMEFYEHQNLNDENKWIAVSNELKEFINNDKKDPFLKWVQGKIWKKYFEEGTIRSHFYPEVPEVFRSWNDNGYKIGIYSSGSIEAQKLYFKYSNFGDLSPWITAYFDTSSGPKIETSSYKNIARELAMEPPQILFLSDVIEELDAAREAGYNTMLALRENTEEPEKNTHPVFKNFLDIKI